MSAVADMGATDRGTRGTNDEGAQASPGDILAALRERARWLVAGPLLVAVAAYGITFLIPPTFTASTTFMPPQQSQGNAASALASLGSLAGLAGGVTGARNTGDLYVALMQSVTVSDRLIERFRLMDVYDSSYRADARKTLAGNVRITLGRKDGLITVDVEDTSPQRAADMANRYVDELRQVTSALAVTEAQQRRAFFERQLQLSREQLIKSQLALQASGFNPGALRAEPRAAADGYAKLRAEVTAAEVRLQVTRGTLTDSAPEVRQQQAALAALREQLARTEQPADAGGPDYIGRYREYKYHETLFDLYARQFELARVDESREGALIQIVDLATPPERKSKPKRATVALGAAAVSLLAIAGWVGWQRARRPNAGRG